MRSHLWKVPCILVLCSLCACKTAKSPTTAAAAPEPPPEVSQAGGHKTFDAATRNNALALLADLLGDEKNVSKVLIIKRNSDQLGQLIKTISKTAGDGADFLDAWAKQEPGLDLKATALPPGEVAARKAISKTKEHLLLHSKGDEFQFQLLLTQVEALNYGASLALVAAENEPNAENTRRLLALSSHFRGLHEQVLAMLRQTK